MSASFSKDLLTRITVHLACWSAHFYLVKTLSVERDIVYGERYANFHSYF